VQHGVSFSAIPEEKALKQDDLNDGNDDESDVDEDTRGNLPTDGGGWKDEPGEDDP